MTDRKKEVIGYYTEDGDINCVDFINKNVKIVEELIRPSQCGGFRRRSVIL
jgi:hypothetical protein